MMNDFTKEELKWVATSITGYDFDSLSTKGQMELKSILNKVLSMIDNYCEHEPSDPKLVLIKHCLKCNSHLETRQWGLHDYK
jgi:hypothetical protein